MLWVPSGIGASPMGMKRQSMWREIGDGLNYVIHHPRLRLLNLMMFMVALFVMPYVMLLAGFVQEDLGRSEFEFGILQTVSGAGALVASLAIAAFSQYDRKGTVQWISGIVGGLGLAGLAGGSEAFGYAGALAATLVLGLALTVYQTINSTLSMEATRPDMYGRVMSINMLSFSVMPLMAWPLGQLADVIGASMMFTIQGGLVVVFMLFMAIIRPGFIFARTEPVEHPVGPGAAWGAHARQGGPAGSEDDAAVAVGGGN